MGEEDLGDDLKGEPTRLRTLQGTTVKTLPKDRMDRFEANLSLLAFFTKSRSRAKALHLACTTWCSQGSAAVPERTVGSRLKHCRDGQKLEGMGPKSLNRQHTENRNVSKCVM